jgi:hypothetical protein
MRRKAKKETAQILKGLERLVHDSNISRDAVLEALYEIRSDISCKIEFVGEQAREVWEASQRR